MRRRESIGRWYRPALGGSRDDRLIASIDLPWLDHSGNYQCHHPGLATGSPKGLGNRAQVADANHLAVHLALAARDHDTVLVVEQLAQRVDVKTVRGELVGVDGRRWRTHFR